MKRLSQMLGVMFILMLSLAALYAQEDMSDKTIAEIVTESATASDPQFVTLLQAIQVADPAVLEALGDPQASFTVFAPTDAAFTALFEAIGGEAVSAILADQDTITDILLFHVAAGGGIESYIFSGVAERMAGRIATLEMLNGQFVDVALVNGNVTINGALFVTTDIYASNGIIHIIDAVLLPETRPVATILSDFASATAPEFAALSSAVGAVNLVDFLNNPEAEFTVFAPIDDAFRNLSGETLAAIGSDPNALRSIVQYHVVAGRISIAELEQAQFWDDSYDDLPEWYITTTAGGEILIRTVSGETLTITITGATPIVDVTVNGARVVRMDVDAGNGILHFIDVVLIP